MQVHFTGSHRLSEEAGKLVDFDVASLRQLLAARRDPEPDIWLARPEGYQDGDHVLRDSPSIRLIAYSRGSDVIYATDGCNSCFHTLEGPLPLSSPADIEILSERTQLPAPMLDELKRLIRSPRS
jgi:hypothetical protein